MNDVRQAILASLSDTGFRSRTIKRLRLQLLKPEQFIGFLPRKGIIYDLGCGFGLCSVAAACATEATIIACDIDEQRINANQKAFSVFSNLRFEVADFFNFSPDSNADGIMLIDSLHYFSPEMQEELIGLLWKNIRPGGRLIIRDAVRDSSLKFRWNQLHEKTLVELTKWTKTNSGKSWFLNMGHWEQIFARLPGATILQNSACHKYLPYKDHLFVLAREN